MIIRHVIILFTEHSYLFHRKCKQIVVLSNSWSSIIMCFLCSLVNNFFSKGTTLDDFCSFFSLASLTPFVIDLFLPYCLTLPATPQFHKTLLF